MDEEIFSMPVESIEIEEDMDDFELDDLFDESRVDL
jgi:hypothetical protein